MGNRSARVSGTAVVGGAGSEENGAGSEENNETNSADEVTTGPPRRSERALTIGGKLS